MQPLWRAPRARLLVLHPPALGRHITTAVSNDAARVRRFVSSGAAVPKREPRPSVRCGGTKGGVSGNPHLVRRTKECYEGSASPTHGPRQRFLMERRALY